MTIQFGGTITVQDVRRALSLSGKASVLITAFRVALALGGTALLASSAIVADAFGLPESGASGWRDLILFLGSYSVLLFYAVLYPYLMPFLAAKRVWKRLGFGDELTGTASEDGLAIAGADYAVDYKWQLYERARISDSVVLLYAQKNLWTMFPRSLFADDDDWQAFVGLVKANVPPDRRVRREWS